MRAAPACQVHLVRHGVWRTAVVAVTALGTASASAWVLTLARPVDPLLLTAALAAMLISFGSAATLFRQPGAILRWDGRAWFLGSRTGEPVPGDIAVTLDFGPWMLLCFTPVESGGDSGRRWLPVQRRGLEMQWHALRCAVYSPRSSSADDTPADA